MTFKTFFFVQFTTNFYPLVQSIPKYTNIHRFIAKITQFILFEVKKKKKRKEKSWRQSNFREIDGIYLERSSIEKRSPSLFSWHNFRGQWCVYLRWISPFLHFFSFFSFFFFFQTSNVQLSRVIAGLASS